jgi:serine/threonine-protein kinase
VYALGVVGFQMIAGEPPFIAPNTPALLLKHVSEPPPVLAIRRPDVPPALAYAVTKALAKDRRDRWASAAVMRDALADNAMAPPEPVRAVRDPAPPPPSVPAHLPIPPFPVWTGGPDAKEKFREAQRAWKEHMRDRNREIGRHGITLGVHIAGEAMSRSQEKKKSRRTRSLAERVGLFQKHVVSNVLLIMVLFVVNVATRGFPWFIFPAMALTLGIIGRGLALWQDGIRFTDLFRRPSHLATLSGYAEVPSVRTDDPAADIERRAVALAGSDVIAGSHGSTVRRAAEDERAVHDILRGLAQADRAQLPDVEPTLRSLVDRVGSLAKALHRLDADVRPEQLSQIDARLADARAVPEGTAERDRRVSLLERQRTTVAELAERRSALAGQLESASLVLHTMRLDLLRLRSAGIGNASDVNNATQEARALSVDIGRVLDAAAEVRKL